MRPDLDTDAAGAPPDWWGPVWAPRAEIGLTDLIRGGLVPLDLATLFWTLIDRNASVVVAAGPSGAGKTTLLTALLELLPATKRRWHAHGMHETFEALSSENPDDVAILVNEISPYLPVYLWGQPVAGLLELGHRGFQFFATCHAESVEEFVYSLCSSPLRIPTAALTTIDVLIFLNAWREGAEIRREIERIVALRGNAGRGVEPVLLFANREIRFAGVASAFGLDESAMVALTIEHERRIADLWTRFGQ